MRGPPRLDNPGVPGFIGATPDASLYHLPILVEIKCPFYVATLEGGVPDLYWPQVQAQMAVTGFKLCHFVRYIPGDFRRLPQLTITEVAFDPDWWRAVVPTVTEFFDRLMDMRMGLTPCPQLRIRKKKKKKKIDAVVKLEPTLCALVL